MIYFLNYYNLWVVGDHECRIHDNSPGCPVYVRISKLELSGESPPPAHTHPKLCNLIISL